MDAVALKLLGCSDGRACAPEELTHSLLLLQSVNINVQFSITGTRRLVPVFVFLGGEGDGGNADL